MALKSDVLVPWLRTRERASSAGVHVSRPARSPALLAPVVDLLALSIGLGFATGGINHLGELYVLGTFVALLMCGSPRLRIAPSITAEMPRLLTALTVPLAAIAALAAHDPRLPDLVTRVPLTALLVVVGRGLTYTALRAARSQGVLLEPTLIVGAGHLGVQIAETLQTHAEYGMVPIGFLDGFDGTGLPLPVLGDLPALDRVLSEFEIRRVVVAFGSHREAEMVDVLRACEAASIEVHVLPRFFELGVAPSGPDTEEVWGIPLVRVKRAALRSRTWRMKRAFDLVVATIALVLSAPIFAMVALAVRVSSPGPVLFRQKRVGQGGQLVQVLKFRTLEVNDDSDRTWSVVTDVRVTPVGKFLRATSLDELPQLLNVMRGEMSLVGPRPERPHFVSEFNERVVRYDDRHRVPVGMTGWAQVHGLRGDTSIEERARFDNRYIEHWSLWRDIVILGRTIAAVMRDTLTLKH
ncbi:MAG: exopolysaccharide biosynthesis polyprenyl glycosylphosphotransferase [Acidimicrobiales bacterium]|jgi:exopolysaccharide biosynthesis polyprenyl glycosylphosphotransferase|nr:exopolysaccharide biosynthesis polyprenyl glycosylphosphotransferase [Acidimicrobiales bacterium]